ncbi:fasciclin domain-containing protein [Catenovulum sp. SM1970]|uniref:fasciclin domain-containing protein n=1 Tax=Marinifaba aquimaris TaxID=2741323 RepID=UPI001571AF19|nr:fasciclin domain-containing protein [Marinifaba aquimaris]NTS76670.1 fasciclin domain-containing protein [Marinifaba aquimaris]
MKSLLAKFALPTLSTLLFFSTTALAAGPANNAKFEYVPTAKERLITQQGLNTLVQAIHAAGMVDELRTGGPYTLLAPNNDAFKKLPAGTLDNLLKPENKAQLIDLLSRHVIEGEYKKADISQVDSAVMLNGDEVKVTTQAQTLNINDAKVINADIMASNGIVHVIDTVLVSNN